MSSQKQIDANRLNAQKSTGPNTPEGRDAVRFNALRHGLRAKQAVLENENEQEFQEMLEAFEAEHQPIGPTEILLVQQMVMAAWRLRRLRAVETGLFNIRMVDLSERPRNTYASLPETERQASAFLEDNRGCGAIEKLSRYETRIERSFYRALHELQRLRKERGAGLQPASPQARTSAPLSTGAVPTPDSCLLTSDSSYPPSPVQLMNLAEQSQSSPKPLTTNRSGQRVSHGFADLTEPRASAGGAHTPSLQSVGQAACPRRIRRARVLSGGFRLSSSPALNRHVEPGRARVSSAARASYPGASAGRMSPCRQRAGSFPSPDLFPA